MSQRLICLVLVLLIVLIQVQAQNDIKGDIGAMRSTDIDFSMECEKRYEISKKNNRLKELENKINRLQGHEKELRRVRKQNEKLREDLRVEVDKNDKMKKRQEAMVKEGVRYQKQVNELSQKIDYQSSHSHILLFEKLMEIIDLLRTEVSVRLYSVGSLYEKVFRDSIVSSLCSSVVVFFRNVIELVVAPAARLLLSPAGLQDDVGILTFLTTVSVQKIIGISNICYKHFSDVRNTSISRLQENPRVAYLAEEVVDLGLLCFMFFSFLIVVNPIISFMVRQVWKLIGGAFNVLIIFPVKLTSSLRNSMAKKKID